VLQNTKYVINLITKYVIKHVTIIKTKMCGLSVACVLDSVMSVAKRSSTYVLLILYFYGHLNSIMKSSHHSNTLSESA
jgi:hypothetical protein